MVHGKIGISVAITAAFVFGLLGACANPAVDSQGAPSPVTVGDSPSAAVSTASAPAPSVTADVTATDPATGNNPAAIIAPQNSLTPMEAIKDLDKQIESYHLGQNLTSNQTRENTLLKRRIIRGTFDIEELCRLSLAKHWETLDEAERKHFVELMTELLEKKAIFSKEQLKGDNKYYHISYLSEAFEPEDKTKAVVKTRMDVPKKNIDLNITYKMLNKNDDATAPLQRGVWKIFDVVVDEASLLANYRFQFDRIIQKGGFKDLIGRMEAKLTKIVGE